MSDPVFQEVDEWLRRGSELRRQLLEERDHVQARLDQIDALLAELPSPDGESRMEKSNASPSPTVGQANVSSESTAPDIVRGLLSQSPTGMGSAEIIKGTQSIKPSVTSELVHSVLYRLAKSGELEKHGKKGKRVYRLNKPKR